MANANRRRRGRRRAIPEGLVQFIARLLPPIYKPFLQTPPPGLTHQQVRTLCHLDALEPICISALAEKMGIKKSATSIMVSRLARLGLAWKERSDEDRRVVLVRLTAEGERVREAPTAVDVRRLEGFLREHGLDWAFGFRNLLKQTASRVLHGETRYVGVGQLALARPLPSPEMPRAPC